MNKTISALVSLTFVASAPAAFAFENVDFTTAADKTLNSVVSVKCYNDKSKMRYAENPFMDDPFFQYFFGQQPRNRQQPKESDKPDYIHSGIGSGVILDADGLIVTNNHVVDGSDKLEIVLNDNRTFDAEVVGVDPTTDLAVLRIEADNLVPIVIGESDNVKVGEWVLAVGNPFGLTSTVTAGIVSAKGRNISQLVGGHSDGIESYIQTDAAVNPGNSGGALVNLNGELIGINTAIYSQTGNYAGNSFAIPTTIVRKVVDDITSYGSVQRAFLGLRYQTLTPKLAKEKGISATAGLLVESVVDGSGAQEAGILPDDLIVSIDGTPTINAGQIQEALAKHRPGDTVNVSLYRDNKLKIIPVELKNNHGNTQIVKKSEVSDLGCSFEPISAETAKKLKIRSGLKVTEVGEGKFKKAGIKPGFIIVDINNSYVTSADDMRRLYEAIVSSDEYDHVMFISGVYPDSPRKVYYAVDLAD